MAKIIRRRPTEAQLKEKLARAWGKKDPKLKEFTVNTPGTGLSIPENFDYLKALKDPSLGD